MKTIIPITKTEKLSRFEVWKSRQSQQKSVPHSENQTIYKDSNLLDELCATAPRAVFFLFTKLGLVRHKASSVEHWVWIELIASVKICSTRLLATTLQRDDLHIYQAWITLSHVHKCWTLNWNHDCGKGLRDSNFSDPARTRLLLK